MSQKFGSFQGTGNTKYLNYNGSVTSGDIWFDHSNAAIKIYNGTSWDEVGSGSGGGGITYSVHTSNVTATANQGIIADTSGGSFTVTLPASPTTGDKVFIADGADFSTNNLTVARNGSTIEGASEDFVMDIGGPNVGFIYDGTTWQVYPQSGLMGLRGIDDNATSTAITIDSSQNVGIGTSTPDAKIHGAGSQGSGDVPFIFENSATSGVATSSIVFAGNGGSGAEKARIKSAVYGDGYMAFHTNDDTEKMRINASGNVGIGTTNPLNQLVISEGTGQHGIEFAAGTTSYIQAYDRAISDYGDLKIDAQIIQFGTDNGTERMRISSGGDVQIGTAAVTGGRYFDIYNTGSTATDFAITRLITQQAGSASTTSADIIKRKNGQFGFINNDTNAAAYINFKVGASERMRIDSSGNVGIGTTSPDTTLHIQSANGVKSEINLAQTAVTNYRISVPASTDALTFLYGASTERMRIDANGNVSVDRGQKIQWYDGTIGSGNVNAAIEGTGDPALKLYTRQSGTSTLTERMRIDALGNVGIGSTPVANTRVYVRTALATDVAYLADNSVDSGFKVKFNSGSTAILNDFNAPLIFGTNDTERMRIDTSGNLLVGKTAASGFTLGAEIKADGTGQFTVDNNPPLYANRKSSNGNIIVFAKDNTTVGSIGVDSSSLVIGGGDVGLGFYQGVDSIVPYNSGTNTLRDDAVDLGYSSGRFKDLYLSGNVRAGTTSLSGRLQASQSTNGTLVSYLQHTGTNPFGINIDFNVSNPNNTTNYFVRGEDASAVEFHIWSDGSFVQASDRRLKDNIVDSGPALETVRSIQVREFDKGENHHSHGFIAQELAEVYPEVTVPPAEKDGDKGTWGVNYPRMVPMLVKAIQEQQAMIEELKAEVAALKGE